MADDGKQTAPPGNGSAQDGILEIGDWSAWHDQYENQDSELNARKRAVQAHLAAIVDQCPPGPVTVVSVCGGQSREVIGALENHQRRGDVRGRIVELDAENAAFARKWADAVQLGKLEVLNGDASIADSYQGLPPADAVVVSGVFGHLSNTDRVGLISFLRQICRNGGCVVWTFFNWDKDETEKLRGYFREQMFNEESLEVLPGKFSFVVARYRYAGAPMPFDPHAKIFTFGSSREGGETAAS
jgi:hypothetical protein